MMDALLEARQLVDWIGASLASPSDLPLPEQLAAATVFILAAAGLVVLRVHNRQAPPMRVERDDLDEAA
jgi:hypothetical protein